MSFTILSKRMLEDDNIRNIVNNQVLDSPIFSLDQRNTFCDSYVSLMLLLKDFDDIADRRACFIPSTNSITWDFKDYLYVVPIVRYEEIRSNSKTLSENDDTLKIECGRGLTSRISSSDTLRKIDMDLRKGDIVETDRKITIILSKDGKKTMLRVYKNQNSGEEYVFMSKNEDGTFDDSINLEATFIGAVSPLTWTVDKKTGVAICNNSLFYSEGSHCEYEQSALAKFLESDEFAEELRIHQEKKQEMSSAINNPFGMTFDMKKEKLSLADQVRNVLIGGRNVPYLVGHPGVGKSEVAYSINRKYIKIEVSQFTPDDFTGKTSIVPGDKIITHNEHSTVEHNEPGYTTRSEPKWHINLTRLSEECRKTGERCSLVIDEFDKLTPNMQVFINGIVSNPRTIADWEIPDNVDIILTGNTEEYSDAAFSISGEVASRLTTIEVKADAIDWLRWASKNDLDPIVKAYIHCFPSRIIQDVKDKNGDYDPSKSLTPRSWDMKISDHIKKKRLLGEPLHLELFMSEECLKDFMGFMKAYFELHVEEILNGDFPADIYDLTHDKVQLVINCLIATATTEEQIINSLLFIRRNNLNEYQALFEKRWTEINNTDADILRLRVAKKNLDESDYGERGGSGYGKK